MSYAFYLFLLCLLLQMNSRPSMQGCPKTISWTCQPYSTCGPWIACSSGDMSSWRTACGSSPDVLRESSSNSSVSVKDVTDSPKYAYQENGEHNHSNTHSHAHHYYVHIKSQKFCTASKCSHNTTLYTVAFYIKAVSFGAVFLFEVFLIEVAHHKFTL